MAKERLPGNGNPGADQTPPPAPESTKSAFSGDGILYEITPTPGKGLKLGDTITTQDGVNFTHPGITRFTYIPTCGTSGNNSSSINLAAQQIYKKIQIAMRNRNLPYQKTDVMINILCHDSIHCLYRDIARAYKCVTAFNRYNRYVGEKLVEALGYDYNDLLEHRNDMRTWLIKFKRDLDLYPMPKVFDFIQLHEQMNNFIYFDSVSDKAQMYVFVPEALYTYADVDTVGGIQYRSIHQTNAGGIGWDSIKNTFIEMMDAIKNSTDFDIISAAIATAFEGEPMVEESIPGEDELPEMYHDPAAMNAIINMHITPLFTATQGEELLSSVYENFLPQDTDNMLRCESFATEVDFARKYIPSRLMNLLVDKPSSTEMTNYARWTVGMHATSDTSLVIYSWGMEIITSASIYTLNNVLQTGSNGTINTPVGGYPFSSVNWLSTAQDCLELYAHLCAFKNHPIVTLHTTESSLANRPAVTITEWNFCSEMPDVEAYHDAIVWKAFMNE